MIFLQVIFKLNLWACIVIGVFGSILGRYVLSLYIPHISNRFFKTGKNQDIEFLGKKMKEKGWKGQLVIVAYSLLPLPTTPLFVAAGIARVKPFYIIPAFFIGKFVSDTLALLMGKYATDNLDKIRDDLGSWKTIIGLIVSLLMIAALLFIDWRTLIQKKKLRLRFDIFK
ncbi:MAG: hypothetical protein ACXVC6_11005 [Bacteroidia bacterium]